MNEVIAPSKTNPQEPEKTMPAKQEPVTGLALLRQPFPANQISKLPKETKKQAEDRKKAQDAGNWPAKCNVCGGYHHANAVHLDYVGHAALTDRLLDADPLWTWEPVTFGPDGLPALDRNGGMWIKLTVCDVTRLGYGSADGKTGGDAVKELIGDALRNAAMRFGAALDLWHKGDLHAPDEDEPKGEAPKPGEPAKGSEVPKVPTLAERADRLEAALKSLPTAHEREKAYKLASKLLADLDAKDPERLVEINQLYDELQAEQVAA